MDIDRLKGAGRSIEVKPIEKPSLITVRLIGLGLFQILPSWKVINNSISNGVENRYVG